LLQATSERIGAAVVVGMMSTYEGLLDHNVVGHTWMFFPPFWAGREDWPDLAASRAPSPLLVQYDRDDSLFTPDGMAAADAALRRAYGSAGTYEGRFYDGPHKFDVEMQDEAFAWLARWLSPERAT
jgi:predicted esterase